MADEHIILKFVDREDSSVKIFKMFKCWWIDWRFTLMKKNLKWHWYYLFKCRLSVHCFKSVLMFSCIKDNCTLQITQFFTRSIANQTCGVYQKLKYFKYHLQRKTSVKFGYLIFHNMDNRITIYSPHPSDIGYGRSLSTSQPPD